MSESESTAGSDAIVYFVVSPLEGPGYRTSDDDELQAVGGVHAFERLLERQSYWFVHLGQIGVKHHDCGFTFQDSDLAQLPEIKRSEPAHLRWVRVAETKDAVTTS